MVAGLPQLARLADRLVISADVGFRKPAPEFFREVIRAAGFEPRAILFVGDDVENDYHGARAAGLGAVLLDPRSEANVERRIASLSELVS